VGFGRDGELGTGKTATVTDTATLGDISLGGDVQALAAGEYHTCALMTTGEVRCWGLNSNGQLGRGHTNNIGDDELPSVEAVVSLGGSATAVTAGLGHTCALLSSKKVVCWGSNAYGQLGYGHQNNVGDNETPSSAGPVQVGGDVAAVAAGDVHVCVLLTTSRVRCWGFNFRGVLGYGHAFSYGFLPSNLPYTAGDVPLPEPVLAIRARTTTTCALTSSRRVVCWGEGTNGKLGYGSTANVGDVSTSTPLTAGFVQLDEDAVATPEVRHELDAQEPPAAYLADALEGARERATVVGAAALDEALVIDAREEARP
jgi:alpha-tubulin suppressor-like RCC1 family protein